MAMTAESQPVSASFIVCAFCRDEFKIHPSCPATYLPATRYQYYIPQTTTYTHHTPQPLPHTSISCFQFTPRSRSSNNLQLAAASTHPYTSHSLSSTNNTCIGYGAAITGAICFGSFGVPAKSKVASRLDIDPLVMQPLRFTPWGIVSGLFWVPGGVAGIYAIRNAGIAMAVGTWSSIIVLTSFTWGILVFEERVKSISGAVGAVMMLIVGLVGMAFFSGNKISEELVEGSKDKLMHEKDIELVEDTKRPTKVKLKTEGPQPEEEDVEEAIDEEGMRKRQKTNPKVSKNKGAKRKNSKVVNGSSKISSVCPKSTPKSMPLTALEMESLLQSAPDGAIKEEKTALLDKKNTISFFNGDITLTRRQAGLIAAAFNGLWGGTNLIPLHFASKAGYGGPIDALPSFYIRQMWFPGMLCGFLYSLDWEWYPGSSLRRLKSVVSHDSGGWLVML
eukprot:scaffold96529_cov78-Cyclotella_meneghiniana.AAC.18